MKPSLAFLTALLLGSLACPCFAAAQDPATQEARRGSAGAIVPLDAPVLAGKPVTFKLNSNSSDVHWELGDGATAEGPSVTHTYQKPGIHRVVMGSKVGETFNELSSAIVRVHTPETLHLPQVILDTDAANEIDDQHAIAYAVFSELDVLAITSTGWLRWADANQTRLEVSWDSEDRSYREILTVLDLAQQSGLPKARVPMVFRGAKQPLRSVGIASEHLRRPWIWRVQPSTLLSQSPYRLQSTTEPTNLRVVHEIDVAAMKEDFWDTLNGRPTSLPSKRQNR
jgi:hypothetical protein